MSTVTILYPVFALAGWTGLILLLIPFYRIRSALRKEICPDDFKYGESIAVPAYVSISNRNYMNLLELPVLFYVVCLLLFITATTSSLALALAWVYVVLRVMHSVIHVSYNKVVHRLIVFAISNAILASLWFLAFVYVSKH